MPRLTQDSVQSTGAGQMEALWKIFADARSDRVGRRWHKDVLEEPDRKRVAEGKVRYADWEDRQDERFATRCRDPQRQINNLNSVCCLTTGRLDV